MARPNWMMKQEFGGRTNTASAAAMLRRGMQDMIDEVHAGGRPCLVKNYNPEKQTVTVVLKVFDGALSPIYFNVPIMGSGSLVAHIADMGTLDEAESDPDVVPQSGFLHMPYDDTRDAWNGHVPYRASRGKNNGDTPLFSFGPLIKGDELPLPEDYEKGDDLYIDRRNGSHLIFKKNGDVVIRAAGNVYIGGLDDELADMKKALRAGDTGDGGLGAGAIPTPPNRSVYIA